MLRRGIDQALQDVDGLGKPGPAHHADRRGVAQHHADMQRNRGQAIDRALQVHVLVGRHAAADAREIGADIGEARDLQCQELARRIERQRRLGPQIARRMVGQEHLAAGGDPFHRPADPPRRPGDQDVLGIDEVLGAEAAADIGRDEAHVFRLDAEAAGGVVAVGVDALAGDVQRVAAGRFIERADRTARLDRVGRDAMIVERQRDDVCRLGKRRLGTLGVAGAPVHADVARHLG
jgi:hypothetical protein